jgi:hypothetical protein
MSTDQFNNNFIIIVSSFQRKYHLFNELDWMNVRWWIIKIDSTWCATFCEVNPSYWNGVIRSFVLFLPIPCKK